MKKGIAKRGILSTPDKTRCPKIFVKGPPQRKKQTAEPDRIEMNTGTLKNSSTSKTATAIIIIVVSDILQIASLFFKSPPGIYTKLYGHGCTTDGQRQINQTVWDF